MSGTDKTNATVTHGQTREQFLEVENATLRDHLAESMASAKRLHEILYGPQGYVEQVDTLKAECALYREAFRRLPPMVQAVDVRAMAALAARTGGPDVAVELENWASEIDAYTTWVASLKTGMP